MYSCTLQVLEEEEDADDLYVHFADFEEFCKEPDRARTIYRYALDHVPRGKVDALYARFAAFEKKHGNRDDIEEVLLSKKRLQVRCMIAIESAAAPAFCGQRPAAPAFCGQRPAAPAFCGQRSAAAPASCSASHQLRGKPPATPGNSGVPASPSPA
jgi:hypothetical protein